MGTPYEKKRENKMYDDEKFVICTVCILGDIYCINIFQYMPLPNIKTIFILCL